MRHGTAATVRVVTIALAIAAATTSSTLTRASDNDDVILASGASQRPFSDFLSAQGSTNVFIPPLPDFIGWSNNSPQTLFASVDYLGLVAGYLASHGGPVLGTIVDGTVMERPLADGRAEVTVEIHATDALTWVLPIPFNDIATDPLAFGYRGTDLLANPNLVPALSSAHSKVVFKNTAPGAPLPDLIIAFILGQGDPGQELLTLSFESNGTGLLRAPSGSPEGTPGRCTVAQTGLFMTGFHGAVGDGFPAERVTIRPVGRGAVGTASSTPNRVAGESRTTWGAIKSLYR
jgi:hypothetical protein